MESVVVVLLATCAVGIALIANEVAAMRAHTKAALDILSRIEHWESMPPERRRELQHRLRAHG